VAETGTPQEAVDRVTALTAAGRADDDVTVVVVARLA